MHINQKLLSRLCFVFFMLFATQSIGQNLRLQVSYEYLHSSLWKQMIQTYNFSRPFLANKQPLLRHGFDLSVSYLFKSSSAFSHGVGLSYTRFGSSAENTGFSTAFTQNFAYLGYILHHQKTENPFFAELGLGVLGGVLLRKVNDEAFEFDDERAKAYGIGNEINLKLGHQFPLSEKWALAPFVGVSYAPYFYAPNTESILNQTTELISEDHPTLFRASIGIVVSN